MDLNIKQNNSEKKPTKKDLEFCIKLFVEKLGQDFFEHLELAIDQISKKHATLTEFKERQAASDAIRKISLNKSLLAKQFKILLDKNIYNKQESNSFGPITLNWNNTNFSVEELQYENKTTSALNASIRKNLGEDLDKVLLYSNYLIGYNHDIFSPNVLSYTLTSSLKGVLTSMQSLCFAIDSFSKVWETKISIHFQDLKLHLEKIGIDKEIERQRFNSKDSVIMVENFVAPSEPEKQKDEKETPKLEVFSASNIDIKNIDLDVFLKSLQTMPKIEKKENSVPGISEDKTVAKLNSKTEENNHKQDFSLAKFVSPLINEQSNKDIYLNSLEDAIDKISNVIRKALVSQQRMENIDFYSLIKKSIVFPEMGENESKIILLPRFLSSLKDIQEKFLKVTPEIFEKTKVYKKSIFLEILKNKLFLETVNYYDIFVLRLMAKTYESIFENQQISLNQKLILFKTQLWILQLILFDQSFWYYKDNPARILFDLIINPELYHNKNLINQLDSIITNTEIPKEVDNKFMLFLINSILKTVENELDKQQEIFSDKFKSLEKEELFTFAYTKVSEQVMSITSQTEYQPIKEFVEKLWAFEFVKKLSKMTALTIFNLPDFTKVLPANMKSMLNQHFIVFDALIILANNKDGSQSKMETLKKFISKANEGLGLISYDLNLDPKLTKSLFSFIKYKLDVLTKTTNPIAISEAIEKISSNESNFKNAIHTAVGEHAFYLDIYKELQKSKYNLNELLKLNHWYVINDKYFKLLYITPKNNFYIFLDMNKNEIIVFKKTEIWEVIKENNIEDFTEKSLPLNILYFLVQCNINV